MARFASAWRAARTLIDQNNSDEPPKLRSHPRQRRFGQRLQIRLAKRRKLAVASLLGLNLVIGCRGNLVTPSMVELTYLNSWHSVGFQESCRWKSSGAGANGTPNGSGAFGSVS